MTDVLELASDDPESYPPIQLLLLRAFRRIGPIAKKETGTGVSYNFRGVDTVTNAVGPILRDLGILPTSQVVDLRVDNYTTKNNAYMNRTMVTLRWRFTGPRGDYVETETVGESADTSDKSATQGHSVSLRVALLQTFLIPTDAPDPDLQHEDAAAPMHERLALIVKRTDALPAAKKEKLTAWIARKVFSDQPGWVFADITQEGWWDQIEGLLDKAEASPADDHEPAPKDAPVEYAPGEEPFE